MAVEAARGLVGDGVGLAGFGGTDLARALGNDAGALPFTVVLAADGRVVARKMGEAHAEDLAAWAVAAGLLPQREEYLAQRNGFRLQIREFSKPADRP